MKGVELFMNDPVIEVFRSEILPKIIEFFQPDDTILLIHGCMELSMMNQILMWFWFQRLSEIHPGMSDFLLSEKGFKQNYETKEEK
jgi:hypothetical protein